MPVPDEGDFEREIAKAVRLRDFELPLQRFWPLAAHELGRPAEDADLAVFDARWKTLLRETQQQLAAVAVEEADRVRAVLRSFPEADRAYAWTNERSRFSDVEHSTREERAFHEVILGAHFERDPSWMAKLNAGLLAGSELRGEWGAWAARRAGGLTIERSLEHERRIAANPDEPSLRQIYADWLLEQDSARGIGEYLQLANGPAASLWRADLLLELDHEVLGPVLPLRPFLKWSRGLVIEASLETTCLAGFFDWVGALTLTKLSLDIEGSEPPLDLGAGSGVRSLFITLHQYRDLEEGEALPDNVTAQLIAQAARLPRLRRLGLCGAVYGRAEAALRQAFPDAELSLTTP